MARAASPLPKPGAPLEHYVNPAPFDPHAIEALTPAQEKVYLASQWRLMWWKFTRHKVAVWSGAFLCFVYFCVIFSGFLAPYNYLSRHIEHIYAPPQSINLFHEGRFVGPFVYGLDYELNMETLKREYTPNRNEVQPLRFFCSGDRYWFWGMFESRTHLVCPAEGGQMFLLGTDRLGRDMLSRIINGARVSMTIGLFGVAVSIVLGIFFGGLAGYFGGFVDMGVQRLIEVLQSLPSIPLWLAIAAIVPVNWSPLAVYLFITIILGLIDWTGLARAVRSKLLSLREEDYVLAAQLMG
ncbi:MAG: ABC transporter permease, partial [Pseudomonadota bacterium]